MCYTFYLIKVITLTYFPSWCLFYKDKKVCLFQKLYFHFNLEFFLKKSDMEQIYLHFFYVSLKNIACGKKHTHTLELYNLVIVGKRII